MEDQTLKIEGTVENVLFRNDSNGYTVLDIDTGGELVTAVGELGDVESGEILIIEGIYVTIRNSEYNSRPNTVNASFPTHL